MLNGSVLFVVFACITFVISVGFSAMRPQHAYQGQVSLWEVL